MIINSISLQNFLGYRDRVEIDFRGRKTIGIVGPNEAGKSTILNAVGFALYGRYKSEKVSDLREIQLINDHADGPLVVELSVDLGGDTLEIIRGRSLSGEAIVRATGMQGKASEVSEGIAEAIGICREDFLALCYFMQGDIHQLMKGDKRAYFQRWTSSLSYWSELEEIAKGKLNAISRKIDHNARDAERLAELLETIDDLKAEVNAAAVEAHQAEQEAELAAEAVSNIREAIAKQKASEAAREALDATQSELRRVKADISAIKADMADLSSRIEDVNKGHCTLLQVECSKLAHVGKEKRGKLLAKRGDLRVRLSKTSNRQRELVKRVAELREQLEASALPQLEHELSIARRTLTEHTRVFKAAQQRHAAKLARLEHAQQAEGQIKQLQVERHDLEKEASRHRFLQHMCGRSGLPSAIIAAEFERIEERGNYALEGLDYPKRLRFSAFKEMAGYEKVCGRCGGESWAKGVCKDCGEPRRHRRKDEPSITVLEGDKERPFALESGGAQTLESFAVRLAGGLFTSAMTGVPMRMIMMDEIFAHLDASNRQRLMALIVGKLSTVFGLDQQFVVSHHDDIVNAVDHMLVVSKKNGSSVVTWA